MTQEGIVFLIHITRYNIYVIWKSEHTHVVILIAVTFTARVIDGSIHSS